MAPDYAQVLDALYEAAADPLHWPHALEVLSDHAGAIGGMLAYHSPVQRESLMVYARLRDDIGETYLAHYQQNPYAMSLSRLPFGRAYACNPLIDLKGLRRSAFHADILAPQAIEDIVAVTDPLLAQPGGTGGVAVVINARQADEREHVVGRLNRLAPHINRAIGLSVQLGRLSARAGLVGDVLDAVGGAAVLLKGDGLVIHRNGAAQSLLDGNDGIQLVADHGGHWLRAELPADGRALARLVAETMQWGSASLPQSGGAVRIHRPSGRPALWVVATALPAAHASSWGLGDSETLAVVQFIETRTPVHAQAARLKLAARLTEAETAVAALIGGGYSVPEAGAQLGLSGNTIKTHLLHCFGKTETHSQSALAALLAAMPAAPAGSA